MAETTRTESVSYEVDSCPACGNKHTFSVHVTVKKKLGVLYAGTALTVTVNRNVACPTKGAFISISVPVDLLPGESV